MIKIACYSSDFYHSLTSLYYGSGMEEYLPIFEIIYDTLSGNEELFTGGIVGYYLNRKVNFSGLLKKKK